MGLTTDFCGFLRIFLTSDLTDLTDVGYALGREGLDGEGGLALSGGATLLPTGRGLL